MVIRACHPGSWCYGFRVAGLSAGFPSRLLGSVRYGVADHRLVMLGIMRGNEKDPKLQNLPPGEG